MCGGPHCMVTKEAFTKKESFQEVLFIHEWHEENDEAHL
jgi:hypothetical protein